jgi:SAM-dependent methyltransferase
MVPSERLLVAAQVTPLLLPGREARGAVLRQLNSVDTLVDDRVRARRRRATRRPAASETRAMDPSFEAHRARRGLFANDVASYRDGRPGYPPRVFEILHDRCGLGPGCRVLEVGPGTGQATVPLLDAGAQVTAIELGAELAADLQTTCQGRRLTVLVGAFEDLAPTAGTFDLVAAATSFHWVPPGEGHRLAAGALRTGGSFAQWWNFFGDPDRPDPFHDALSEVLARLEPSLLDIAGAPPYALDVAARVAELDATGCFGPVQHEVIPWTGRHSPTQLRTMFASFSPWLALPEPQRTRLLAEVERLATVEFDGLVERPYLTPMFLAERRR